MTVRLGMSVRLCVVGPYPPRSGRLAGYVADLVRALARRLDTVVCALDRHGLDYPDDVVAIIRESDRADYRRAGLVLAEYAVDAVLLQYDDDAVGDRGAAGLTEFVDELGRQGIPYLIGLHSLADPPAALAALARGAARTLVYGDEAREAALALRLVDRGRLSRLAADASPAVAAGRIAGLVRTIVRRDGRPAPATVELTLSGLDTGPASMEEYARQAVVSARLLGRPGLREKATLWAGTALHGLEPVNVAGDGWPLYGLGVLAGQPELPEALRRQARARRNALARTPADPYAGAFLVLGLVGSGPGRALVSAARRLGRAGRAEPWPGFGDRLEPASVRLPQALLAAGRSLEDEGMVARGLASLDWYAARVGLGAADAPLRLPSPVERAVDVGATVEAFVEAYRATGRAHHARWARRAFDWFAGANRDGVPVYDAGSAACRHVLGVAGEPTRVATLAYLSALLALADAGLAVLAPTDADGLGVAA